MSNLRAAALAASVLVLALGASRTWTLDPVSSEPDDLAPVHWHASPALAASAGGADADGFVGPLRGVRTRPATNTGPRGGATTCFAPPVPGKTELPPFREPAPAFEAWRLGPREARERFGVADTSRVLFLLAEFADVPFDTTAIDTTGSGGIPEDELLVRYFERQLDYVREFYTDVSYGRLVFRPTVLDTVIPLPYRMAYYGNDDLFSERGTKLIWDAVRGADPGVHYGDYDGLVIIHSGAGQESDIANDSEDQIWSAFFQQELLSFVMSDSLDRPVPGIPTADTTAEGDTVWVEAAALVPETERQDGWPFGLMGVVTHELGHVMAGWPDLYDTTPDTPSQGLGAFCLMAAGTWNGNGHVPGEPSAWARSYAGWLDPVTIDTAPDEGRVITLRTIETDDPAPTDTLAVRIPISADEYFLVACRQPDPNDNQRFDWTGMSPDSLFSFWTDSYEGAEFDYFTPNLLPTSPRLTYEEGEGLYIWHIDESVIRFGFPYNLVNADPHHLGIDLEEADGLQEMEYDAYTILSFGSPFDAFREGNATEFTPWTTPSTHGSFGSPSGVVITDIGPAGDTMSFRVRFLDESTANGLPVAQDGWPVALPGMVGVGHPMAIDLDGDPAGDAELVMVGDDGTVIAYDVDGTRLTADTLSIGGPPAGAPLAANLDGDPELEVVVAARAGGIHRFDWSGTDLVPMAILATDSLGATDGVLADVGGDARPELVIGSVDAGADSTLGRLHRVDLDPAGGEVTTYELDGSLAGSVVVVPGLDLAIQPAIRGGLRAVPMSPVARGGGGILVQTDTHFGPPTVADLQGDGIWEVLALDDAGRLHALTIEPGGGPLDPDLRPVAGWPVVVGGVVGSTVSAADVDADGYLEVLVTGTGGSVHVVNHNGVYRPGWPKFMDVPQDTYYDLSPVHPGPFAADVSGDGRLDLLPVFGDGRVMALPMDDRPVAPLEGWPLQAAPSSVPVVGDLDGDGRVEVFAVEASLDSRGNPIACRATLWGMPGSWSDRTDAWTSYRGGPTRQAVAAATEDAAPGNLAALGEVYCQPNPGPDGTRFHYRPGPGVDRVEIRVYDASGLEVRRLDGTAYPGVDNLVPWDATNDDGNKVAAGLYVYRITASGSGGTESHVGKLALVR